MFRLLQDVEHCDAVHLGVGLATAVLEISPHQLMFQASAFARIIWSLIQISPASDFGQPVTDHTALRLR
jgi:hypothetical protein